MSHSTSRVLHFPAYDVLYTAFHPSKMCVPRAGAAQCQRAGGQAILQAAFKPGPVVDLLEPNCLRGGLGTWISKVVDGRVLRLVRGCDLQLQEQRQQHEQNCSTSCLPTCDEVHFHRGSMPEG
eukprot:scaffold15701_cov23-Tisochrysis_lutea.AAC.1